MNQAQSKADELFFVVDENDRPLEPLPRRLVHGHGVWHRTAHVWVVNDKNQVLCQQRSFDKELLPGMWELFFGGHLHPDETYAQTAMRELQEELGIKLEPHQFKQWNINKYLDASGYNNEFQAVFVVRWNGSVNDLYFSDNEVEQADWKQIEFLEDVLRHDDKWNFTGYELELLDDIKAGKV